MRGSAIKKEVRKRKEEGREAPSKMRVFYAPGRLASMVVANNCRPQKITYLIILVSLVERG